MRDTQKKILRSAKKLFNKFSFSNVTIRMIAQEMGISSGNLNYHFKKREDILEALYFEMVEEFDKRIEELPAFSLSFENIFTEIKRSMLRMIDYRFFWTDIYNLLHTSQKIKEHFHKTHEKRIQGYLFLFNKMKEAGLIKEAGLMNEYLYLAERMVSFSNTWLYESAVYDTATDKKTVDKWAKALFLMFFPYLTERGKTDFLRVLPA